MKTVADMAYVEQVSRMNTFRQTEHEVCGVSRSCSVSELQKWVTRSRTPYQRARRQAIFDRIRKLRAEG